MNQIFVIFAVPIFFVLIWYRYWKNDSLNREIRKAFREFEKIVSSLDINRLLEIASDTSPTNRSIIDYLSEKAKA